MLENTSLRAIIGVALGMLILGLTAGPTMAATVTIVDASFETPTVTSQGEKISSPIGDAGWWRIGSDRVFHFSELLGGMSTPYGDQALGTFRNTTGDETTINPTGHGIQTTLITDVLEPATVYTLTYNAGNAYKDGTQGPTTNVGATAQLLAGSTVLAVTTVVTNTNDMSQTGSIIFASSLDHPALGETLQIRLFQTLGGDYQRRAIFDNVVLTADTSPVINSTGVTSDWNVTTTWDTGTVPTGTEVVNVTSGHQVNSTGASDAANWLQVTDASSKVTVDSGAALSGFEFLVTNGGEIDVAGSMTTTGSVLIRSGSTLNVTGTLTTPLLNTAGTVTVDAGADISGIGLVKVTAGTFTGSGATGGLTLGGSAGDSATVTTGAGILTLGGNVTYDETNAPLGATISGALDLGTADRTFTVGDSTAATNDLTVSADVSGTGVGLTKAGGGTLILSGTNTYTGMTSINAGALVFGKQAAMNGGLASITPSNVTVESGAALGLGVGDSGDGYFDSAAIGTVLSQMGASDASTGMKPGSQIGLDTTSATGGTFTHSSVIADLSTNSIGLAKLGEGQLILDAANTYSGPTTVYAGTLTAGAGQTSAFGSAPSLAFSSGSTGAVQLNGNDITVSSLSGAGGTVENGAATDCVLTVNHSSAVTYGGTFADGTGGGKLTLTKDGGGTMTLTGANTHSGGTVINAGKFVVSSDTNLGDPSGGIAFNGTSTFGDHGNWTVGSGRTITLNEGANVDFDFGNATLAGPVVGNGSFSTSKSVQGNPGLNLTNTANTFTGAMDLNDKGANGYASYTFNSLGDAEGAGIIRLGAGGQGSNFIWGTGAIAPLVLNYRQFDIAGTAGKATRSTIDNANTNPANTITIHTDLLATGTYDMVLRLDGKNTGDNTIAGGIADGANSVISLEKYDNGKWILAGGNTYTGPTTVSGGTLVINGGCESSDVTVSNSNTRIAGGGTIKSLTVNANAGFIWSYGDGEDHTLDIVIGDLVLNDNWVLKLVDLGDDPLANEKYDLFTYNGIGSLGSFTVDSTGIEDWDLTNLNVVDDGAGRVYITGVGIPGLAGDINGDDVVDAADYVILKQNFNSIPSAQGADGDLNGDNFVDATDLNLLAGYLNAAAGAAVTPEPATLALLAFGGLALIRRNRR